MKTKIIEARTKGMTGNWGKFLVGQFSSEWNRKPAIDGEFEDAEANAAFKRMPLLRLRGWSNKHIMVLDIETGEGAIFRHGGNARADLNKHRIWVCPLFEPFLSWLYKQDVSNIDKLPDKVELDAEFMWHGHRRPGPTGDGHPEYHDPSFPERHCDNEFCRKIYTGPAVYCSFTCALADR